MHQSDQKRLIDSNKMKIIRWIIFVPLSLCAYMFAYIVCKIILAMIAPDENQSNSEISFLLLLVFSILATIIFMNVGMKIAVDKRYSIEILYNLMIVASALGFYQYASDKKYLLSVPFLVQLAVSYYLYRYFKKKNAS